MRFRLRTPSQQHVITLSDSATISDFYNEITKVSGCMIYDLKAGFPPRSLELADFPSDFKLLETGINFNGEQIILTARTLEDMGPLNINGVEGGILSHGQKPPTEIKPQVTKPAQTSSQRKGNFATLSDLKPAADTQASGSAADPDHDPPSVPLRNGKMVLRVMPDDNSCLFRALGTAILGNALDSAIDLRSVVTDAIREQPDVYSEAVLQKAPADYCRWIMRDSSWGGYIETKAIAENFGLEVVTLDVKTGLATKYNEDATQKGGKRCFIIYSGIHYDVLAFEPGSSSGWQAGGGGDMDQYQFDPSDQQAMEAALAVAKLLKGRNYYTDTSSFEIKCNTCGWKGSGEKVARVHAKQTGHSDFVEA
jgi:ubiquitin thioesterase OTU1